MVKVLIAEDDRDLLDMAKSLLWQVHGITVEPAGCAEEALQKLRAGKYDAMVVDHDLPDLNGLEVLELLRVSGDLLPYILFLPKDRAGLMAEALERGTSFCLRKSGDPTLLISELGNMIKVAVQMRRTEEALVRGDESFWSILSQSQEMILIVDANATACYLNPSGARMLGVAEADVVGSSVVKVFHSDDVRHISESISQSTFRPGLPVRLKLRGRCRGRNYLCLEGEALSTDGRTVIMYLADVSSLVVNDLTATDADDIVLWRDMRPEQRERRQRDLTRDMTFRLISRMLVDRMSESETAVSQNRFRAMGGLSAPRVIDQVPLDEELLRTGCQAEDDVMSQLIDRLAVHIDLMEIGEDARRVQEANRRFYGPD